MKQPGSVYVYHQPSDDGNPVELFVPQFVPGVDPVEDFATSVLAVVETVRAFEHRDRESVFADLLGGAGTGRRAPTAAHLPTPEQVRVWLSAHGWTPEDPLPVDPEDGVMFTYKEPADDGQPITVVAPRTIEATPRYPLRVRDLVVTAAGMEERPEADVFAEMLATDVASAPHPPSVPMA
jgi:hypothetical protein